MEKGVFKDVPHLSQNHRIYLIVTPFLPTHPVLTAAFQEIVYSYSWLMLCHNPHHSPHAVDRHQHSSPCRCLQPSLPWLPLHGIMGLEKHTSLLCSVIQIPSCCISSSLYSPQFSHLFDQEALIGGHTPLPLTDLMHVVQSSMHQSKQSPTL